MESAWRKEGREEEEGREGTREEGSNKNNNELSFLEIIKQSEENIYHY